MNPALHTPRRNYGDARTLARRNRSAKSLRALFAGRERKALTFTIYPLVLVFNPNGERVSRRLVDSWQQELWITDVLCACEQVAFKLTGDGLRVVGEKNRAA